MTYKEETIKKVSELLAHGFNSREISLLIDKHEVTVRKIKIILKERYKK